MLVSRALSIGIDTNTMSMIFFKLLVNEGIYVKELGVRALRQLWEGGAMTFPAFSS